MRQQKSKNFDALWADGFRRALIQKGKEPVGEGWLTAREIRAKSKLSEKRADRFLREEQAAGRMEVFKGSQYVESNKQCQLQLWYRPTGSR